MGTARITRACINIFSALVLLFFISFHSDFKASEGSKGLPSQTQTLNKSFNAIVLCFASFGESGAKGFRYSKDSSLNYIDAYQAKEKSHTSQEALFGYSALSDPCPTAHFCEFLGFLLCFHQKRCKAQAPALVSTTSIERLEDIEQDGRDWKAFP